MEVVRAIEKAGSDSGKTKKKVLIVDCGQIWKDYTAFVKDEDGSVLWIPNVSKTMRTDVKLDVGG